MAPRLRWLLVFLGCALAQPLSSAELSAVRVFHLSETSISVMDASQAVHHLLSDRGSLTIHPRQGRLMVQDSPEVVERVTLLMDELTRPPQDFRIRVELLEATRLEVAAEERAEVAQHIRRRFPFPHFRRLGTTVLGGDLRGPATVNLTSDHQVAFEAKPVRIQDDAPWGVRDPGARVHLEDVRLLKRRGSKGASGQVELLRTSAILGHSQRAIFGVSASAGAERALILILEVEAAGEQ
jgi:hypothetical protein